MHGCNAATTRLYKVITDRIVHVLQFFTAHMQGITVPDLERLMWEAATKEIGTIILTRGVFHAVNTSIRTSCNNIISVNLFHSN